MDKKVKQSIKAAYKEFEKEPMDDYYQKPIIGYISRLRVKKIIQELKKAKKLHNKTVLDAGCEAGYISLKLLKNKSRVIAFDICKPAVEELQKKLKKNKERKNIKLFVGEIHKIPLKDNSVDAIVCSEVIEHVPYLSRTIKELNRVLRPGGVLIITFPNEKLRKFLYPFIKLFGVDTSVEKEVTLHDYKLKDIVKECKKLLKISKVDSIPPIFKLTHIIICKKRVIDE